jgi:putative glutamine amidotransferase
MQCKPLIGLNADYRDPQNGAADFSYLSVGYADCILQAGGIPVVVPPLEEVEDVDCLLDKLQGFVLIGGQDLDPNRDGFMTHPSVRTMNPRRESFDRMLAERLAKRRIPVYGIGVGMQLLNVTRGGNLFLHIPEDLPDAVPHKDPQDPGHRHGLEVEPGSLLESVYGDGEIRVGSMHHMAIDEVAPGFVVTARSPDGVIEAIESDQDDWFAIGTQFHPESLAATALDARVMEEFVAGVMGRCGMLQLVA